VPRRLVEDHSCTFEGPNVFAPPAPQGTVVHHGHTGYNELGLQLIPLVDFEQCKHLGEYTEKLGNTYVGQQVITVSAPVEWLYSDEHAALYPEGHNPGEKYAVEPMVHPEGKQPALFAGPRTV
jgi:hypothetical protein